MNRKSKRWLAGLLAALLATLTACGGAAPAENLAPAREEFAFQATAPAQPLPPAPPAGADSAQQSLGEGQIEQPRIIIYSGSIELVVKDTAATVQAITALAGSVGGYVSEANIYNAEGVPRGSITIRVPAETYQQVLQQLRDMAVRVEEENSSTQDVTEEFVDLEARKANLERTEAALQELLATRQKTGKTEDILDVYRELTNVRGQIEQIQGRLNYLSRAAALSTIRITLTPDVLAQPITVAGWQPTGIAREAFRALISALQWVVKIWIWLLIFVLPLAIVLFAPLILVIWLLVRWRRSRKRRAAAGETPSAAGETSNREEKSS
ncbi:MAG: DUF4349 domain-containing protein [Anaerolineae bacterium]